MKFIGRFLRKTFLASAILVASFASSQAQTGVAPRITFLETDQTLPAGLWRISLNGDVMTIDRNTAAANNFTTLTTAISIASNGDVTIPNNFFVTGSATVTVDTTVNGQLVVDTNNLEALLVRKDADAGDRFWVDTLSDPTHVYIQAQSNADADPDLRIRRSRAGLTSILTGDSLGAVEWYGHDGSNFLEMAAVVAFSEGTVAATRVPTRLEFKTGTDATPSVMTTGMRLTSGQNVELAGSLSFGTLGSTDVFLERGAANILALRNSTNNQTFHLYGTFTDTSNYERLSIFHELNAILIDSQAAGTGTPAVITLRKGGSNILSIASPMVAYVTIRPNSNNQQDLGTTAVTFRTGYFGTSLRTGLFLTSSADALILDAPDLTVAGQQDSHSILWTGLAFDSVAHDADWKAFVDVTSNAGASTWTLQSRVDAASFASRLTVTDAGNVGIGTTSTTGLGMGDDKLIARDTNAGLTASTTQTQGQGALTAEFNEVSTVANTNDTVTLPTAVAGLRILVINNGANTLQVFPASGDDLGLGVDTATTLGAAAKRTFEAFDATTWGTAISVSGLEIVGGDLTTTGDVVLASGNLIQAANGGGTLDLRNAGVNSAVALSGDTVNFTMGWLYAEGNLANIGFSLDSNASQNAADIQVFANSITLRTETTAGVFATRIEILEDKIGFFTATPVVKPSSTSDIKDSLVILGLITDGGATPLDLDGGAATLGSTSIQMGTGTGQAQASGKANVNTTAAGTDANTVEKDLITYSLPANSLSADGKVIKIIAWGTTAANGNEKTIRIYFGGTVVRQLGTAAFNNQDWIDEAIVVRTGTSAQDSIGSEMTNNNNVFLTHLEPAENTATALTIKVTGQNGTASANDIVAEVLLIEYLN